MICWRVPMPLLKQTEIDAGDPVLALVVVTVTVTVTENTVEEVEEETETETETGHREVAVGLAPPVAIAIVTVEAPVAEVEGKDISSNRTVHSIPAPHRPLPPRPTVVAPVATGKRPTHTVLPRLYLTPGIVTVAAVLAINSQTTGTRVEMEEGEEDSTLRMAMGKEATLREQEEGGTVVDTGAIKTHCTHTRCRHAAASV